MDVMELYKKWSTGINFDVDTKVELLSIKDVPDEIRDRFYKELDFGTAGIRGIIGAGTNRINKYVIRRVSHALAKYLLNLGIVRPSVMIGFDSRHFSEDFAKEAASVFSGLGVKAYMHTELCPVPAMSYSIRLLKCTLGVLVTASHNPKEYNGYKVFGEDGSQLSTEQSKEIIEIMSSLEDYSKLPKFDYDFLLSSGKISIIGDNIKNSYFKAIRKIIVDKNAIVVNSPKLKLIYTPLHGAGANYIPKLLSELGFNELYTVESQMIPDGDFPTVKVPNPEDSSVYELAIKLAEEKGADLILATDPDADRTGAAIKNLDGEYVLLNGNQIGVLLLDYIITGLKSKNRMPENPFVVSTIVSTRMTQEICAQHNIEYIDVFTGFKYIGSEITKNEEQGNKKFIFGFEESYGYLPGSYARDKDAVATCLLLAECAAYYNEKGMNLLQAVEQVYVKYGHYSETQVSLVFEGESGQEKSKKIMDDLRRKKNEIINSKIEFIIDYKKSEKYICTNEIKTESFNYEKSDVLYYKLGDSWFCIRPSGTEPKIKIYFGSKGDNGDLANEEVSKLKESVMKSIKALYE